ncbi:MAG TPA: nucleotide pyrophosphohydrolase [Burkholderiaceae bacterium]|nr:nucleotide pyrophosphohydrolase [Burkholderiaceae bacterium]
MHAPPPNAPSPDALTELRDALRAFSAERDWDRFHAPKNLAAALVVEAGELLEPFQWLSEDQSAALPPDALEAVRLEMAEVLLYLVRLADRLDVDLADAARRKMALNALKYPVDRARGRSDKYDRL